MGQKLKQNGRRYRDQQMDPQNRQLSIKIEDDTKIFSSNTALNKNDTRVTINLKNILRGSRL